MRAIGIVRQSKGRDEALSPAEQRDRIAEHCARESLELLEVHEEIDVSGGTPLAQRTGLSAAVEAVENGDADLVLVAYFDRLVRSLRVQDEVVSRIEAAGGRVVAVDFGEITGRTAAQWLSGTMIGAVSEYFRRSVRERSVEAQAKAVARGVVPWPSIPPGYRRRPDRRLEPDPSLAPVVLAAFEMRFRGQTISEIREHLRWHGIERSYNAVTAMLRSRIYLGEIHFGELSNTDAHEAIVPVDLWRSVQTMRESRGAYQRSNRLLARLGVLRCGNCGARMVVSKQSQGRTAYAFYRCPPSGDCRAKATISAHIAEDFAVEVVKDALADLKGRASAEGEAREAWGALELAQSNLDAGIRAFQGLEDETAARERLKELRGIRDACQSTVEHLSRLDVALTVRVADWNRLTLEARRGLIRATVAEIRVGRGRGPERLSAELLV